MEKMFTVNWNKCADEMKIKSAVMEEEENKKERNIFWAYLNP